MDNIKLLKDERIKDVKGFEGRFMITDYSRLFSINGRYKGIKEIIPNIGDRGYKDLHLLMKPKKRRCRLHQLVGEHFVENPYNKPQLNHIDGNKLNNHYLNLEWCTGYENIKHAVRTGLMNFKGENHHNALLTEKQVYEMHELRKQGLTHKQIGLQYNISRRHICDIINGVCWPHIYESLFASSAGS